MRYAPITYATEAKIKIVDDTKETNIASEAAELLGGPSSINLENETEVLRSYRMLRQVATFRANFIAADHPGLQGRELKPLDPQPEVFVLPPKENKAMQ